MSAENNLSKQLFHGTIETLHEGQHIVPEHEHTVAWATTDLRYAIDHAQNRMASGLGFNRPEHAHPHHGNVYEVSPIGAVQREPYPSAPTALSSKEGFVVKRQVLSVLNNDRYARENRDPYTNTDRPFK